MSGDEDEIRIDDVRRRQGAGDGMYDTAAEAAVLGAMLLRADAIELAAGAGLGPDHFTGPGYSAMFAAATALYNRGEPVDPVTVADEMGEAVAAMPDGRAHFLTLQVACPSIGAARKYAEIVVRKATERREASAAAALHSALMDSDPLGAARARSDLAKMAAEGGGTGGPIHAAVRAAAPRCSLDGAAFILDAPAGVPAVWGQGDQIAWAGGEPLLLCGPAGVGKTTVAQQLALARLGLGSEVLGLPVAPDDRRVLYVAADRPPQAARSLARMVTEEDRELLTERLIVWRGPLPFNMIKEPEGLAFMCEELTAGTVILDSLKDVAGSLSEDESGSAVNRALQLACLDGVEVVALHHQRKRAQLAVKPRALEDVYGSTWLTAGAGSVVLLWGEAGDPVVELTHLKQPAEDIGPIRVLHDHAAGRSTVVDQLDLLAVMVTLNGLTAQEGARRIFDTDKPTRNEVEKARRRLDGMVRSGVAFRREGQRGGGADRAPARWHAVTPRSTPASAGWEVG